MKYYIPLLAKKYKKFLINDKLDPLLGAYLISRKKCPTEKLINKKRKYL